MQVIPETLSSSEIVPLVVDLDGTLIQSDILIESAFACLGADPTRLPGLAAALCRGKAALKAHIAELAEIDPAFLPYDPDILELIREARALSSPVYLASASNEKYVLAIAEHLGLFDGWFASNQTENLSASAKARRLVEAFGSRSFDYIGNDKADLHVWRCARQCIAVRASQKVREKLINIDPRAKMIAPVAGRMRAWIKLTRIHQWAKNGLVLVPLLTAHKFDLISLFDAIGAFFSFSLAASGIYIINDLVDIEADRKHPSKKRRPLAAGIVPIQQAVVLTPVIVAASLILALIIAPAFAAVLFGYLALTTAYTFFLKRKMMIDVVILAALYTVRVIGGAAAISVAVSEWLLGFSMFIFISLALIKRYTELASRIDGGLPDPTNRNYRKSDLDIVAALAAAAGFNAVTVFALYISSETVHDLYRHPKLLWLICPILMYWLGRALMLAHRRDMNDDPIVFALKDRNSLAAVGLMGVIVFFAL